MGCCMRLKLRQWRDGGLDNAMSSGSIAARDVPSGVMIKAYVFLLLARTFQLGVPLVDHGCR